MIQRSNEEWLAALSNPPDAGAVGDLRDLLIRGLGAAFSSRRDVRADDIEDFAQDALVKILDALDSFRGESRFTTWAQKIAVRVALTEMRRKRWQDWSLDDMLVREGNPESSSDYTPAFLADPDAGPDVQAVRRSMVEIVQRTIAEDLSERQRTAMTAVMVHGVPLEEVAERMGAKRNAMYKLLHDARRKLKRSLEAADLSTDEILAAFE